jgi:hypothetical protein
MLIKKLKPKQIRAWEEFKKEEKFGKFYKW